MFNVLNKHRPMMEMGRGGGGMGGACYVYDENQQANPNLVTPDVVFQRGIDMNIPLTMDDGNTINMWGYTDGRGMGGRGTFPSPPIRVSRGQIVHTVLSVNMM